MIAIDFDKFQTDADFELWLESEDGYKVVDHVYEVIIHSLGGANRHIPVIMKKYDDGSVYSIDMKNINGFCIKALKLYLELEEYEKCNKLQQILTNKNK